MTERHGPRRAAAALLAALALLAAGPVGCRNSAPSLAATDAEPVVADSVRALTGRHTRVVWVQHGGEDVHAQTATLVIGGYDSEDERGERLVVAELGNYAKPLLTPNGDRVVFSSRHGYDVHVVNWDGTGRRRLGEGFALATWKDAAGVEWIYAGRSREDDAYGRVVRFPIDRPDAVEPVWSKTMVGEDSFDLSEDGTEALAMLPWPRVGLMTLATGTWQRLGDGCWTALVPGDRPLAWWLDDAHRRLIVAEIAGDARWSVALDGAPGFEGAEVYHPRRTADPRIIAVTGPFDRGGWNQVRSGGPQVEVHLGRFDDAFTRIEAWVRVTSNQRAEGYPDVWLAR